MASNKRAMSSADGACSLCSSSHNELKCLPCSHNVCTVCLQRLLWGLNDSPRVHCPIDRNEFLLSTGGIDSLPTRGLLVEVLSEHQTVPMDSKGKKTISNVGFEDRIEDSQRRLALSLQQQETRVKADIRSTAQELVDTILAKEKHLCKEVEKFIESEKQRRHTQLVDFAVGAAKVEKRQDAAKQSLWNQSRTVYSELRPLKEIQNTNCDLLDTISFKVNREYVHDIISKPFGKLELTKSKTTCITTERGSQSPTRQHSQRGNLLYTLSPPIPLKEKFRPWVVDVSESGHIAVVDRGNNCIHIFNPKGNFLRHVGYSGHAKNLEVYSVTFVSRDTLATAEYSRVRGSGHVIELNIFGEPLRVIGDLKGPAHVTSFASHSKMDKKIVAVYYTTSLVPAEVFSIDDGEYQIPLVGSAIRDLVHPHKGVSLDDKLFFSDAEAPSNKGSIKGFNSSGELILSFGEHRLWNDMRLGSPLRIAADPVTSNVLAYQASSGRMVVYDAKGVFLSQFSTIHGVLDFAVSPVSGNVIATCGENSEFPNTVAVLTYS